MQGFLGIAVIVIVIAMIVSWWQWIVGCVLVAVLGWLAYRVVKQLNDASRARKESAEQQLKTLEENASLQHQLYLQGDDRGIYGDYQPAKLDD